MDIMRARYFLQVAKYESMTRAARELHIAEPAISLAMKHLAEEVGFALFQKRGRNIQLTEEGKEFYEELTPLIEKLDNVPETIRHRSKEEPKIIHLNALACHSLIVGIISAYRKKHQDVRFRLTQNEEETGWDYRISLMPSPERKWRSVPLYSERIGVAVSAGRDMEKKLSLYQLKDEDMILPPRTTQFGRFTVGQCMEGGFDPRVAYESEDPRTINDLVAAGMGIAFWPVRSWGKPSRGVRLHEIDNPVLKRIIYITTGNPKDEKTYKSDFYRYLVEFFSDPGKSWEEV